MRSGTRLVLVSLDPPLFAHSFTRMEKGFVTFDRLWSQSVRPSLPPVRSFIHEKTRPCRPAAAA